MNIPFGGPNEIPLVEVLCKNDAWENMMVISDNTLWCCEFSRMDGAYPRFRVYKGNYSDSYGKEFD